MMIGRPELKQSGLGDHFFDRVGVRLRLPDDGKIETPGQAAELFAGPRHAGAERQRLGRHAGPRGGLGKAVCSGLGGVGIVAFLGIDHVGGDIAGARQWNDRIVQEGNPGDVRLEGCGDRDCVLTGEAAALTQAEINEDVFDHGSLLGAGRGRRVRWRPKRRHRHPGKNQMQARAGPYFLMFPSASNCLM